MTRLRALPATTSGALLRTAHTCSEVGTVLGFVGMVVVITAGLISVGEELPLKCSVVALSALFFSGLVLQLPLDLARRGHLLRVASQQALPPPALQRDRIAPRSKKDLRQVISGVSAASLIVALTMIGVGLSEAAQAFTVAGTVLGLVTIFAWPLLLVWVGVSSNRWDRELAALRERWDTSGLEPAFAAPQRRISVAAASSAVVLVVVAHVVLGLCGPWSAEPKLLLPWVASSALGMSLLTLALMHVASVWRHTRAALGPKALPEDAARVVSDGHWLRPLGLTVTFAGLLVACIVGPYAVLALVVGLVVTVLGLTLMFVGEVREPGLVDRLISRYPDRDFFSKDDADA